MYTFAYQPERLAYMVVHCIDRYLESFGYFLVFHAVPLVQQEYFSATLRQCVNVWGIKR